MTNAFTAGITFKRGDGAGTEVFTVVPEMTLSPNLGVSNELIDVSNFDSAGYKEYIASNLKDGIDINVEWNLVLGDTQQDGVVSDVNAGTTRNYQLEVTDGTNTETFTLSLVPMGWNKSLSLTEANKLSANFKISGAITVA